jgi:hypothetical protein
MAVPFALMKLRRVTHRECDRARAKEGALPCAVIDGRSAVQAHILEHLRQYVALHTRVVDGKLVDLLQGCRIGQYGVRQFLVLTAVGGDVRQVGA